MTRNAFIAVAFAAAACSPQQHREMTISEVEFLRAEALAVVASNRAAAPVVTPSTGECRSISAGTEISEAFSFIPRTDVSVPPIGAPVAEAVKHIVICRTPDSIRIIYDPAGGAAIRIRDQFHEKFAYWNIGGKGGVPIVMCPRTAPCGCIADSKALICESAGG